MKRYEFLFIDLFVCIFNLMFFFYFLENDNYFFVISLLGFIFGIFATTNTFKALIHHFENELKEVNYEV